MLEALIIKKQEKKAIGNLYYSKVYTSKYGIKSFKYHGIKILNYLKSMDIYQNAISKSFFLKQQ